MFFESANECEVSADSAADSDAKQVHNPIIKGDMSKNVFRQ